MTPKELRESILFRAVQGRLTEQLTSDGNAKDLLKRLHIDKKIIPTEEPFDIPGNWLWIPIGNLGESTDTDSFCDGPFGSNLKRIHQIDRPEVRIIQLSNIGETGWRDENKKYTSFDHLENVIPRCEVQPGDLVIAKMMPAGRTIEIPDLGTRITLGSDAMKFVPNSIINKQYLLFAMASKAFLNQVYAEAHGVTRVRTTLNGIKSYVLPIPPLAEQKRIVAKIEELLPLVDRYEEAWTKLEAFNKRFPEDLQKSILQMAIQGKLVPQDLSEGTGEELFLQIQNEKTKLIEDGKIKKGKPLPDITKDELSFDIPNNWKWTRLGYVIDEIMVPQRDKPPFSGDIPWCRIEDRDGIFLNGTKSNQYVSEETVKTMNLKVFPVGTILSACSGASIGTILINTVECCTNQTFNGLICNSLMYNWYLFWFLKSMIPKLKNMGTGSAMVYISQDKMRNIPFPLPPFSEQKRIVTKLEELLPVCERLR